VRNVLLRDIVFLTITFWSTYTAVGLLFVRMKTIDRYDLWPTLA